MFNSFVNSFKSMINASYTGYNDISIRESLDQHVTLQKKTDLSFCLSNDLFLKIKRCSITQSPEKGEGTGGVDFSIPEPWDS